MKFPARWLPGFHVRAFPAAEVTRINAAAERAPREVGLDPAGVDAIWSSVVRLYETGLHPAIGLCVRRRGEVVIDRAIGHASGNAPDDPPGGPRVQATPDTLFNLYSASKAITAMLVHLLDERGLIHLDDEVADYVPEFARRGKGGVTIRHILTHRAGIPNLPGPRADIGLISDPKRVVALLCDAEPESVPGRQLAYHALSGGYILGELVERVTGRDVRQFLRNEVLDPLGFKHLNYGVRPDEISLVAQNAFTGQRAMPPYSWLIERSLGVGPREAVELSNDPGYLTSIVPSGNVIGTSNEASRFFQLLLDGGTLDGVRVFDRRTVRRAVAEQSFLEIDSILGVPVRYGMGFMLGSKWASLYGRDAPHAFGHVGFTNVVSWADPDRAISVSLMTSGKPFITPGQVHWINVAWTIARVCAPSRS